MLDYLHANNFTAAYNSLKADAGTEYTPDPKAKYSGLLEKKWTSVIRLQKKVRVPVRNSGNEMINAKMMVAHQIRLWILRTATLHCKRSCLYPPPSVPPPRLIGFLEHPLHTSLLGIELQ